MIIQKTKEKYIEELLKYGEPPSLEELQCLNLLIDILRPYANEEYTKETDPRHVTMLSDAELRNRTVNDSGRMIRLIFELTDILFPWYYLKVYLPRYKKVKKKIIKHKYPYY